MTQGQAPRGRARAPSPPAPGALCPRVPRPPPPFRPVAARRLRPLARRLSSAAAAPVTATPRLRVGPAPPPPPPLSPGAADNSPAFPGCLNGSGDVSTWSLGPAPVKSPSRQGLAASLSRRGCPAWSCVRHGSRLLLLLLPARPPALLPPPPPPAPRNLRPLAFPSPLPALPASPAPAPAVEKLVGEGRNAPPSASGAGEPGNRRRHLPTSPAEREGPGKLPPAVPRPRVLPTPPAAPRRRGPARGAALYLKAPAGPWPWTPHPPRTGAPDPPPGFTASLALGAASEDPASRHFGPNEEGAGVVTFLGRGPSLRRNRPETPRSRGSHTLALPRSCAHTHPEPTRITTTPPGSTSPAGRITKSHTPTG